MPLKTFKRHRLNLNVAHNVANNQKQPHDQVYQLEDINFLVKKRIAFLEIKMAGFNFVEGGFDTVTPVTHGPPPTHLDYGRRVREKICVFKT